MSANSPRTTTIAGSDDEWLIEDPTRRVVWTDDTGACSGCGSTFRLDTAHYYVTLQPAHTANDDRGSREFVFCDRSCAEEWLQL